MAIGNVDWMIGWMEEWRNEGRLVQGGMRNKKKEKKEKVKR